MERTFLQGGRLKRSTAKINTKETMKNIREIAKIKTTELDTQTYERLRETFKNGQTHARVAEIPEGTVLESYDKTLCMYDYASEIYKLTETDLTQFGLNELDYIDFLDFQLYEELREIEEDLILINENSTIAMIINKIERIMTDTLAHRDKIRISKEKILNNMEEQAVDRRKTPCDYPDNEGHYSCPYDAQGGDDCRNFCGLGVDE